MRVRFKSGLVIFVVLTILVTLALVQYQRQSGARIEYHKRALLAVDARKGKGIRVTDSIREWLGGPPANPYDAAAYHQKALIEAGFLSWRELTLMRDYDVTLFSPSNMLSVGGEFSRVWFAPGNPRQLTVVAQTNRIEQLTGWILEHDRGER